MGTPIYIPLEGSKPKEKSRWEKFKELFDYRTLLDTPNYELMMDPRQHAEYLKLKYSIDDEKINTLRKLRQYNENNIRNRSLKKYSR